MVPQARGYQHERPEERARLRQASAEPSIEPPRISGEADAVNGPTALEQLEGSSAVRPGDSSALPEPRPQPGKPARDALRPAV